MRLSKLSFYFLICVAFNYTNLHAQLKVGNNGGVGLGIEPRSDYKLIMKGNLLLTTYPEIPPSLSNYTELRFKVGNGWPGCEFGTPTRRIAVWSTEVGYNDLYAANYYTMSDQRYKSSIKPLKNSLAKLREMKPYSYLMSDSIGGKPNARTHYGFLAQEVMKVLPEMADSAKEGSVLLNYQMLIPFLVAAVNDQQTIIDSLKTKCTKCDCSCSSQINHADDSLWNEIEHMKSELRKVSLSNSSSHMDSSPVGRVFQNHPNPFDQITKIDYEIFSDFSNAQILICNLQGQTIKSFPIINGIGSISMDASSLTSGIYMYTLIVDSRIIDSKQMLVQH